MRRFRSILGVVGGAMMILSSAAHSLLGWKELRAALERTTAEDDLIRSLGMGWQFGGAAMLAFGCIVVALFSRRLKGTTVSALPAVVIGTTYVVFGVGALAASRFDPFFLVFVVPGVMVLTASFDRRVG
jgi:hypothetical protein